MSYLQRGRGYVKSGNVDYGTSTLKFSTTGVLVVPYQTAALGIVNTAPGTNGELRIIHKNHVPYLAMQSGGTIYYLGFPAATHGTATFTIGGTV